MPDLPIGTVTFHFADVEARTRHWEASPAEMRAALARYDQLVQEHVDRHSERLLKPRGEAA